MNFQDIVAEVAEIAGYLWEKGWAERNAGNISINVSEYYQDKGVKIGEEVPLPKELKELAGMYFLITGTGKRMRDVQRKPMENMSVIKVNDAGNKYQIVEGGCRPTSEAPAHLSIHGQMVQNGGKNKLVLHTHPTELIALSHSAKYKAEKEFNDILWGMHPEAIIVVPRGVGMVPYEVPGTQDIADLTLKSLENHDIVVWEKHGCLGIGESLTETFDLIDTLNKSAQMFFICKSAGIEPEGLTDKNFDDLKVAFNLNCY